jgi:hypothetical protein
MTFPAIRHESQITNAGSTSCTPEQTIKEIKGKLDAWAGCGGKREQRDVAVQRIKLCMDRPLEVSLDLSELGLTEAPPHFPETLEAINLRGNRLKEFSAQLPNCLRDFKLNRNVLTEIKAQLPEGMKRLDVSYNQLSSLPALPNSLEFLAAAKNLIAELPSDLPSFLSTDFRSRDNYARADNRYPLNNKNSVTHAGQPEKGVVEADVLTGFRQKGAEVDAGFARLEQMMVTLDAPAVAQKMPEMADTRTTEQKFVPSVTVPERPVKRQAKADTPPIQAPVKAYVKPNDIAVNPTKKTRIEEAPPKAVSQEPVSQVLLPNLQHTKEKIPAAPGFVMDSRFGEFGYSRENPPSYLNHQFRLTAAGEGESRFDMRLPRDPLNAVELEDTGYAAHIEYADGRRQAIVPGAVPYIVHTADAMHGRGFSLSLPSIITANIVHLPQAGGGADYITFTVSEFNPDNATTIRNTYYVPFGTYQQQDGTIIGIAYCGDQQIPYRFNVDSHEVPLEGKNATVTLTFATDHEIQCMSQFQIIVFSEVHTPSPILASARQLKDETIDVKEKFDAVFECNRVMIDDAIDAERRFPDVVERMLAKLVGRRTGDPKLRSMLNTISHGWKSMRDSMPYLKLQSPNAVGFFEVEDRDLKGQAKNGLMKMPVDLKHINSPLLAFSRPLFMDESVPLKMLASTFRHEWSHAFLNTSDQMDPHNTREIYQEEDPTFRTVSLADIEYFASLKGSEPENHAATLEFFTEMCSYLSDPATRGLAMQYLKSPASHSYTRAPNSLHIDHKNPSPHRPQSRLTAASRFSERRAAGKPLPARWRPVQPSVSITSVRLRS